MFLTKMNLNYNDHIAKLKADSALADRHEMHKRIFYMFGADAIYRVIEKRPYISLLVLSKQKPIEGESSYFGFDVIKTINMEQISEKFKDGSIMRFNVVVSPSKKKARENKISKRSFISNPNEQCLWLNKQGEKSGFKVEYIENIKSNSKQTVKRKTGEFYVQSVEMSGVLRITDSDKFWSAWENGIGPEKPYGCGLMLFH